MNNGRVNNQLNFHQLYIFYVVARCGSFSGAAREVNISQPAVSIQVQELERNLGVSLFHRKSRGLQLTDIGSTVYSYAQRIFALSDEMQGAIQDAQGLRQGHLIVGASTTPGEFFLPVVLGRFHQLYPGIRAELVISNTRSIVDRILQRELDLGIIGDSIEGGSEELAMSTYATDEIILVASPGHPLVRREAVSVEEIASAGLVTREEGSATRKTAEQAFAAMGVKAAINFEVGSTQAVKQFAAAGLGIGVVSRYGVAAELKAGFLCVLNVRGWRCTRNLTLIYLKDRHLSPAQRALLELLQKERPLPSLA